MTNYTRNGALLSKDEVYRYRLWREWEKGKGTALFIMLNPSTADAKLDDATIRRCVSFAKAWGHNRLEVVNLFALRSRNPIELYRHLDPIGPDNFRHLVEACEAANTIVCGWGTRGDHLGQAKRVKHLLKRYTLNALHLTRDGHPGHPLYLPSDSSLVRLP